MFPYDSRRVSPRRDVPEAPRDLPERTNETLLASGMLSTVSDAEGEGLGHILMLDYDDIQQVSPVISMLDHQPGVSVLLQSSKGSYHGYNLTVRPIEQQIYRAAQTESEAGHVRSSARRDYFVLRWTAKLREPDKTEYKPAPEVIWCSVSETDDPQSEAHLQALAQRARETDSPEVAAELESYSGETVGSNLSVEHYQTLTDEMKGREGGE